MCYVYVYPFHKISGGSLVDVCIGRQRPQIFTQSRRHQGVKHDIAAGGWQFDRPAAGGRNLFRGDAGKGVEIGRPAGGRNLFTGNAGEGAEIGRPAGGRIKIHHFVRISSTGAAAGAREWASEYTDIYQILKKVK